MDINAYMNYRVNMDNFFVSFSRVWIFVNELHLLVVFISQLILGL